jgi:hypothetical protein
MKIQSLSSTNVYREGIAKKINLAISKMRYIKTL